MEAIVVYTEKLCGVPEWASSAEAMCLEFRGNLCSALRGKLEITPVAMMLDTHGPTLYLVPLHGDGDNICRMVVYAAGALKADRVLVCARLLDRNGVEGWLFAAEAPGKDVVMQEHRVVGDSLVTNDVDTSMLTRGGKYTLPCNREGV